MVKETQKAKIERLERENEELRQRLNEQIEAGSFMMNDLADLRSSMDNDFRNSSEYISLQKELEVVKTTIKILRHGESVSKKYLEGRDRYVNQLEQEIQELKDENESLQRRLDNNEYWFKDNDTMKQRVEELLHIGTKRIEKISQLEREVQELKNENNSLKEKFNQEPTYKLKNERGAGRKPKFTEHEKEIMRMYRMQGKTLRELAYMYDCSIGVVHKIINEQPKGSQ